MRWLRSFRWLIQSMWWRLFDPSDLPPDFKKDSLSSYVRIVDESFWPLTPFEFLINVKLRPESESFSWWDQWVLFGFTEITQDPVWVIRKGIKGMVSRTDTYFVNCKTPEVNKISHLREIKTVSAPWLFLICSHFPAYVPKLFLGWGCFWPLGPSKQSSTYK